MVAVLWLQGETDGDNHIGAEEYKRDLKAMIRAYRADLDAPSLPFVIGQMVPDFLARGTRSQINAAHAALPDVIPGTIFVPSPSGEHKSDGSHFNATAQRIIGRRMFEGYARLVGA